MVQQGSGSSAIWWKTGAILGALGVLLGAFGAHGLENIASPQGLEHWDTASQYQLVHALALLGVAAHPGRPKWAGRLFVLGIVLFSGSLYLYALTGISRLGMITPLGGLSLIAGWIALARTPLSRG